LLEIQSEPEYKLAPYDRSRKDEWEKQREAKVTAYHKIVAKLLKRVAAAVGKKSGQARTITANTLWTRKGKEDSDPQEVPLWDLAAWSTDMSFKAKTGLAALVLAASCLAGIPVFRLIKRRLTPI
jgi:hypothetical protein